MADGQGTAEGVEGCSRGTNVVLPRDLTGRSEVTSRKTAVMTTSVSDKIQTPAGLKTETINLTTRINLLGLSATRNFLCATAIYFVPHAISCVPLQFLVCHCSTTRDIHT